MNSLEPVIADRRQKAFERFANKNAVFQGCLIKERKNLGHFKQRSCMIIFALK